MATYTLAQAPRRRALRSILAGMILLILTFGASTQVFALAHFSVSPGKGKIFEYAIPTPQSEPMGIVQGPGGLWFTESAVNQIGKLVP